MSITGSKTMRKNHRFFRDSLKTLLKRFSGFAVAPYLLLLQLCKSIFTFAFEAVFPSLAAWL